MEQTQVKIAIFGTGYVGLVAACCFADSGLKVVGVDIDEEKIKHLKDGICPIYEPGLTELLKSGLLAGRLEFTTDGATAANDSDVIFIAVGTPEGEDGSADLRHVLKVAEVIGQNMTSEKIVVLKSTVPVGTASKVADCLKAFTKVGFDVVSNPEFLKEGASLDDFLKPDRVVIGCQSQKARETMEKIYQPFVRNGNPILFMSNKAAELTKYAANAFLATKISFINELALLADAVGADINEVKKGFTTDSRINPAFFFPGVGYGGSCFPKDVQALVKTGQEHGVAMTLVTATDKVNDRQKTVLLQKIKKHYGKLDGITLGLWGLSFKPRTDDVREAPAFPLIEALLKENVKVKAYDPVAIKNSQKYFNSNLIEWCASSADCAKGSDGLVIVTEWNEFRNPDLKQLASDLKQKIIFDGRNIFDPPTMRQAGFTYYCIGRDAARGLT